MKVFEDSSLLTSFKDEVDYNARSKISCGVDLHSSSSSAVLDAGTHDSNDLPYDTINSNITRLSISTDCTRVSDDSQETMPTNSDVTNVNSSEHFWQPEKGDMKFTLKESTKDKKKIETFEPAPKRDRSINELIKSVDTGKAVPISNSFSCGFLGDNMASDDNLLQFRSKTNNCFPCLSESALIRDDCMWSDEAWKNNWKHLKASLYKKITWPVAEINQARFRRGSPVVTYSVKRKLGSTATNANISQKSHFTHERVNEFSSFLRSKFIRNSKKVVETFKIKRVPKQRSGKSQAPQRL